MIESLVIGVGVQGDDGVKRSRRAATPCRCTLRTLHLLPWDKITDRSLNLRHSRLRRRGRGELPWDGHAADPPRLPGRRHGRHRRQEWRRRRRRAAAAPPYPMVQARRAAPLHRHSYAFFSFASPPFPPDKIARVRKGIPHSDTTAPSESTSDHYHHESNMVNESTAKPDIWAHTESNQTSCRSSLLLQVAPSQRIRLKLSLLTRSRRRVRSSMPPSHHRRHHLVLLLLLLLLVTLSVVATVGGGEEEAACDAASRQQEDAAALRPDRLTVLLSGYSERRLPLLRAIAGAYAAHPLVLAVIVLWCNPSTPDDRLLLLRFSSPAISLHHAASASLNSRFLPHPSIRTAAVAVADDDVLPDAAAISFAFAAWQQQQARRRPGPLVGFFPRSHHLDLARGRWAYAAPQPGRYSMVLTKFMVLGVDLLRRYSCSPELAAARAVVDQKRNCEDILMNFVAAEESGEGPVLVEAGSVRDWGDPRNDANAGEEEGGGAAMKAVGLSSRGGMGHWEKRGECITEFHRLLGRMPLRYSYGKVVEAAVAEQGLCSKGGRLVRCDQAS